MTWLLKKWLHISALSALKSVQPCCAALIFMSSITLFFSDKDYCNKHKNKNAFNYAKEKSLCCHFLRKFFIFTVYFYINKKGSIQTVLLWVVMVHLLLKIMPSMVRWRTFNITGTFPFPQGFFFLYWKGYLDFFSKGSKRRVSKWFNRKNILCSQKNLSANNS